MTRDADPKRRSARTVPNHVLRIGSSGSWTTAVSHGFTGAVDANDFGPLVYPWAGDGRAVVMDDPTGVLSGKVVRIEYILTAGNSYDSDRAIYHMATSRGTGWATYGESAAVEHRFVIPSAAAASDATTMRKLQYLRTAAAGSNADGTDNGSIVPREYNGFFSLAFYNHGAETVVPGGLDVVITRDVAHTLRIEFTVNSADGVFDGSVKAILDGVTVKEMTGVCLLYGSSGVVGGLPARFFAYGMGYQFQGTASTSPANEYRYVDSYLCEVR